MSWCCPDETGKSMKGFKMKKYLTAALAAAVLLSLAACESGTAHPSNQGSTGTEAVTPSAALGTHEEAKDTDTDKREFDPANDDYWESLRAEWHSEKEEGYVWTITIDEATVLDAMGLAEVTYDLDLSCSHVGEEMNGVYCGELSMSFSADLSGLNELMGAMGGTASTDSADGWFRNDAFAMRLEPYDAENEALFNASLEVGEAEEADPYTQALVSSMLDRMGSGSKAFEENTLPVSHYFDWDYHMTEGDMSNSYSVTGIMGIGSASGGIDASGKHISGYGIARSPLGGVYTDRYSEDFFAPFPHIIRVYESGDVVFELHSATGGPVVIKFYGTIDRIPVSETSIVR